MNSAAAIQMSKPIANPEVIGLLEEALLRARRGELIGVGIVMVLPQGGVQCSATGADTQIYVGCDQLKAALLAQMQGKRSPILRPM